MWVFDEWGKIENPRKGHNQNVVLICQSGALAMAATKSGCEQPFSVVRRCCKYEHLNLHR